MNYVEQLSEVRKRLNDTKEEERRLEDLIKQDASKQAKNYVNTYFREGQALVHIKGVNMYNPEILHATVVEFNTESVSYNVKSECYKVKNLTQSNKEWLTEKVYNYMLEDFIKRIRLMMA